MSNLLGLRSGATCPAPRPPRRHDLDASEPVVCRLARVCLPTVPIVIRESGRRCGGLSVAVIQDVLALGAELERSCQVYVRGMLKFRVGQLVYVAFSREGSVMGFAFPKEERAALVGGDPRKFQMPAASDMRFNWVHAELASLEPAEARELVVDAWRMVVPAKVARGFDLT